MALGLPTASHHHIADQKRKDRFAGESPFPDFSSHLDSGPVAVDPSGYRFAPGILARVTEHDESERLPAGHCGQGYEIALDIVVVQ